jgi:UDP-N-acetylmuramate--alanine ligase
MTDLKSIKAIFFVGIGGIGMSAIAMYFINEGISVSGYDRSETLLTRTLASSGCEITYTDSVDTLPPMFRNPDLLDRIIIIYTPAIPAENNILGFFREKKYTIFKRSEILGEISKGSDTLAIAGTHGKTSVSAMTAHLLKSSELDCTAFLGGISKNYDSNLITGKGHFTVIEADEFDRSFHRLNPMMAVVTSVDPDHLDVYGDHKTMIRAYNEFCSRIKAGGRLFVNSRIRDKITVPGGVAGFTYGDGADCDFRYTGVRHAGSYYSFNVVTPDSVLEGLWSTLPGIINIENFTAAIAVAISCGVTEPEIRQAVRLFMGVKRRFDIRINTPGIAYVDDYAHHPEEIRTIIASLKEFFPGRRITGIFQPHLFTRTRDHAVGFAAILDQLDEVFLLPIYPAREKPIPGVTSEMIFSRMNLMDKKLISMDAITEILDPAKIDVLVTIGAGDIDRLVGPFEDKIKRYLNL